MSRIVRAAEEARKRLSFEPHATIREENLIEIKGVPRHVELDLHRDDLEQTILPLLRGTLDSVHRALEDAGKGPADLDGILLVGGATRTPLVSALLEETTGLVPRQDLHPARGSPTSPLRTRSSAAWTSTWTASCAATEKVTGLSKQTTIERATAALTETDLAASRARVRELFAGEDVDEEDDVAGIAHLARSPSHAQALLTRSRALLDRLPAADREEAIALNEQLHFAIEESRSEEIARLSKELEDFLFFVEER